MCRMVISPLVRSAVHPLTCYHLIPYLKALWIQQLSPMSASSSGSRSLHSSRLAARAMCPAICNGPSPSRTSRLASCEFFNTMLMLQLAGREPIIRAATHVSSRKFQPLCGVVRRVSGFTTFIFPLLDHHSSQRYSWDLRSLPRCEL